MAIERPNTQTATVTGGRGKNAPSAWSVRKPVCFSFKTPQGVFFRIFYFEGLNLFVKVAPQKVSEEINGYQPSNLRTVDREVFNRIMEAYEVR